VAIQGRQVNRFFTGKIDAKQTALLWTVAQIAAIWIVSDVGYYYLLPPLGAQPSYNDGSIAVTLYYAFWIGIAVIVFWPVYASWPQHGLREAFENRLISSLVWSLSFAGCLLFAAYVLPMLPSITWEKSWSPPEMVVATPWYFLPKSIDILFQQLLILALVLALAARPYGILRISIYCAVGFGAVHALLAFGDVPLGYVIRFMISAAAFGFIFPYLLLRVPNGLAYSYVVHWVYYALSVILPHIFLASSK
jgi:hypothetical protein